MPPIIEGREPVIRPEGQDWSFTLPDPHTITLTWDERFVILSTGYASAMFEVLAINSTDPEEIAISVGSVAMQGGGAGVGGHVPELTGYPLPSIDEEFERLRSRCRDAGGDWQRVGAWAEGDTHETCLRRVRGELRALEVAVAA
jgi:hypothetical protein